MKLIALAGACLCLLAPSTVFAAPQGSSHANANRNEQQSLRDRDPKREEARHEFDRQARQFQQQQGACPDGQHAPGNSANAPGSPFNPDGHSNGNRGNSNYQHGCHDDEPASP